MIKYFGFTDIIPLALALSLSTASGVLASSAPKSQELESIGSAESNEEVSTGLSAEAHIAERNGAGNILSVTWSIKNNGNEGVRFNWPAGVSYSYSEATHFSGVTAATEGGGTVFHPIMDGVGDCLCSGVTSIDFKEKINPGEQVAYWSMYSVPEDVDTITLEIPGFEPIEDIPIS